MADTVGERRAAPRLAAALEIERATLRPGCLVAVLDLSANGAQVQSERPLRPGSRITFGQRAQGQRPHIPPRDRCWDGAKPSAAQHSGGRCGCRGLRRTVLDELALFVSSRRTGCTPW